MTTEVADEDCTKWAVADTFFSFLESLNRETDLITKPRSRPFVIILGNRPELPIPLWRISQQNTKLTK